MQFTVLALLGSATTAIAQSCTLPTTYKWNSTGVLAQPKNGWVSLKDFTYAPYNGKHLVYATNVNGNTYGSMNFGLFSNWNEWRYRGSISILFCAKERMGPCLSVGRDTILLQDIFGPHQCKWLVAGLSIVYCIYHELRWV